MLDIEILEADNGVEFIIGICEEDFHVLADNEGNIDEIGLYTRRTKNTDENIITLSPETPDTMTWPYQGEMKTLRQIVDAEWIEIDSCARQFAHESAIDQAITFRHEQSLMGGRL